MGVIKNQGIRQSIITYIGVIIGFVNIIYIFPRFLEVEEIGLFRFLIDTSMLLFPFISLGVHNLSVRMFPTFKNENNGHNGLLLTLLLGVSLGYCIFLIAIFLLEPHIAGFLTSKSTLIQKYWTVLIPLSGLTILSSVLTQWLVNFKKIAIPAIFNDLYIKIGLPIIAITYFLGLVTIDFALKILIGIFILRSLSLIGYIIILKQWKLKPNFSFFTRPIRKE